jgi:predicted PurR-regulated permease PerM
LTVAQEAAVAVRFLASRLVEAIDHASEDEAISSYLERHPSVDEARGWVRRALNSVAGSAKEAPPSPRVKPAQDSEISLGRGLFEIGQNLGRLAAGLLRGLLGLLFNLVLMLFLMFFFFRDGPQILRSIRQSLPVPDEYQDALLRNFRQVSRAMIRGIFLTAMAQGTVAGIAYSFLGIPAVFWGAMTGLCGMVPILGTGIVTVPVILSFVLNSQWLEASIMAAVAAVVALMDNFLRPWLAKGGLQLHPVWILLSMLGGVSVFGPLGLVIGPMVVILVRTLLSLLFQPAESH